MWGRMNNAELEARIAYLENEEIRLKLSLGRRVRTKKQIRAAVAGLSRCRKFNGNQEQHSNPHTRNHVKMHISPTRSPRRDYSFVQ
jgi:hypothetical protein